MGAGFLLRRGWCTHVMMRARDVLEVVGLLDAVGVAIWLDGGWGVDALLGEQTRPHDDLDVVLAIDQISGAQRALAPSGYIMHTDELPTRCVLRDPTDRRIDFHPVTIDAAGVGRQRLFDGTDGIYPAEGFSGQGVIGGHPVRCLTPEVQLLHHLGYEPDKDDRSDVRLLCERFGLEVPAIYA